MSGANVQIRVAGAHDLDNLVALHLQNFNPNELSVMLGRKFIREFYCEAIKDEQVVLKVMLVNRALVSCSMILFNYVVFEKNLRRRSLLPMLKLLFKSLMLLRLKKITGILSNVLKNKLRRRLDPEVYNYLVGAFIIDKQHAHEPVVIINFIKMLKENINLLKAKSPKGFWASCRESNTASSRLLKDTGMKESFRMNLFPEDIIVFEYRK